MGVLEPGQGQCCHGCAGAILGPMRPWQESRALHPTPPELPGARGAGRVLGGSSRCWQLVGVPPCLGGHQALGDPPVAGLSPSGCMSGMSYLICLCPHTETHSMSLLNTTDPQAGGPMLTAGGSGEHREQEGALCLALSWGAQDSRGVHEALGSQFLSMAPCQAQPSGSGGSWGCRIPCWGC